MASIENENLQVWKGIHEDREYRLVAQGKEYVQGNKVNYLLVVLDENDERVRDDDLCASILEQAKKEWMG